MTTVADAPVMTQEQYDEMVKLAKAETDRKQREADARQRAKDEGRRYTSSSSNDKYRARTSANNAIMKIMLADAKYRKFIVSCIKENQEALKAQFNPDGSYVVDSVQA